MRLASREQGLAGPEEPVLLLHGLFGQGRNFGALQARLAETRLVATLDLRNHGLSPHAPGMDYRTLAADVMETLDALGWDRCAVLGHSMGGKVAMRLALDAPARVTRLLVADIAPVGYPGHGFAAYAAAMRALPLAPGLTRKAADAALAAAVPDAGVRGFLLQSLIVGQEPGWRIGLEQIGAGLSDILNWPAVAARYAGPTLFVAGGRSNYIAPVGHAAIASLFPAARFAILPSAGHWLHVDDPAGFLALVRSFVDEGAGQADEPDDVAGRSPATP